ncbi:MAG: aminotransferase [Actinobacteria bacterium HGW-Actinobacteria-2]|nr:MAG: aminotransferase [Actinobacteria bacterium HGW-Actinobacteria-2]
MDTAPTTALWGTRELASHFDAPVGYLAAASNGILPREAVAAMTADIQRCGRGQVAPSDYDPVVADTRALYAALVGVDVNHVALGAVTSSLVAMVAAGLPDGAEVLVGAEEFTSVVFPFVAGNRLKVRTVPLAELASAITASTDLVAFSLVQSATGEVVDTAAIREAAARHGALTLADLTQAAGVLPVAANDFDVTVCHAYKWLCTPRGVAFLTVSPDAAERLVPVNAGWYSADDPWANCYWPQQAPSLGARRFDTAPAWQAFVGARESLRLFAATDISAVWAHAVALADQLSAALDLPAQHRAVLSWPDPEHRQLARLTAAGVRASGPLGRLRVAFHVWNTEADVAAVLDALS